MYSPSLQNYDLDGEIKKIAWFLPNQGPIKDFVHQNILQAYLDLPFEEAVVRASKFYKARAYMDLGYYRQRFKEQKVSVHSLEEATDYYLPALLKLERDVVYHALFAYQEINNLPMLNYLTRKAGVNQKTSTELLSLIQKHEKHPGVTPPSISNLITQQIGEDFENQVHQVLLRCMGSYLDQGVSLWTHLAQWPNFIGAITEQAQQSMLPLAPFINNKDLACWLKLPPEQSIPELLKKFLKSEKLYTSYLEELLFAHPGWSGMVKMLASRPETLSSPRDINLTQMLAVKLAFQWQYLKHQSLDFEPISPSDLERARAVARFKPSSDCLSLALFLLTLPPQINTPAVELYEILNGLFLQKIWHRALEESHYERIFSLFKIHKSEANISRTKTYQVIFCVDDRECSFRRLLEKEDPGIETFGTAGFFGIDCYFESNNNIIQKICPTNLIPQHIISEKKLKSSKNPQKASLIELAIFMSRHGANNTLLGLLSAYTIGHLSLFSLLASMLHLTKWLKPKKVSYGAGQIELLFEQKTSAKRDDGLMHGYTCEEMADRIASTLTSMGMGESFSRLVFIIGHGSSSVNNPHFSAYDCQACSGRPGAVNARIFAAMANLSSVRALLKKKGLAIPDETIFVGGFHDTCTDQVLFFETEKFKPEDQILFNNFMDYIKTACGKNAQERCRKFSLVPAPISPAKALKEVEHRAYALFEPRPELGHALNALCVVGRRERSYHLNFERRSFLQSYNPHQDPSGLVLSGILSAVIPVCGHINLDYYFSRLDPAVYGCGTKLSHNVCGLIGVGNGLDDDLRTGLPIQMTEMHEPVRLLIIIEQQAEIILSAMSNNPTILPWVKNSWVKIAALDPDSDSLSLFQSRTNTFV